MVSAWCRHRTCRCRVCRSRVSAAAASSASGWVGWAIASWVGGDSSSTVEGCSPSEQRRDKDVSRSTANRLCANKSRAFQNKLI